MTNSNVTALNTGIGNGTATRDPAAGNGNAANPGSGEAGRGSEEQEWVGAFCREYGEAMLLAGQIFLYIALAMAIAIAAIEIFVAFKTAT
ncbi:MAG: hypothetical protein M3177_08690, partial [Pseudomonadota bacterium]|nr:hypothetical protein [Pseudomonadota bacterium]